MKNIILSGDVGWEITPEGLRDQLKGEQDVRIFVNSPGGYVWDGVELNNVINDHKGHVTVVLNAVAASSASFFPLSANKVLVRESTTMFIHNAINIAWGNAKVMKKASEILFGFDGIIANYYVNKTSKSLDEIEKAMSDETWFFGGQACIDFGLADGFFDEEEILDSIEDDQGSNIPQLKENEAKALVDGVISKMRKQDNENAMSLAAKIVDNNKIKVSPKKIVKNKVENKTKKATKNKTKKEDITMSLEQILAENKEVKAEYDASLNATRTEEQEKAKASLKSESERVNEILNLSGALLTEETTNAIKNGLSAGEFAKNKVLKAQNIVAGAVTDGSDAVVNTSSDQSTTDFDDETLTEAQKVEANVDKAFENKSKGTVNIGG